MMSLTIWPATMMVEIAVEIMSILITVLNANVWMVVDQLNPLPVELHLHQVWGKILKIWGKILKI